MEKPRCSLVLNLFGAVMLALLATASVGHAASNVVGWGNNSDGQRTIASGLSDVVAIAAGDSFSLALTAEGRVVGWGLNTSGQTTIPSGLSNVVAIATGYSHRLARTAQGGWSAVGGTITARRSSPALGPTRGDDSLPGAALRFDPSLPPRPWESVCSLDSASINTPLLDPTPNPSRTP